MYCARCFHSSRGRTAENTVGTQPTDVQQLKAEIAAYLSELNHMTTVDFISITDVCNKLRQLSAV
jgi:hypothetical protein